MSMNYSGPRTLMRQGKHDPRQLRHWWVMAKEIDNSEVKRLCSDYFDGGPWPVAYFNKAGFLEVETFDRENSSTCPVDHLLMYELALAKRENESLSAEVARLKRIIENITPDLQPQDDIPF